MQERYIATADLGSSKIAISVAKVSGDDIQVIYYKETPSNGIRYSSVFNPGKATEALKKAVSTAETELGLKFRQLVVGLPRCDISQETAQANLERSNPDSCITSEEVANLKSMAKDSYPLENAATQEIYGAVAQSFNADDLFQQSEHDIVGATASSLEGNFKVFVGSKRSADNIDMMLNNLGIAAAKKVFLPLASAGAVLMDNEKDNGVALIEMGAGVTSVTIYVGKILRYYNAIPFGGASITADIKTECAFKQALAENVKLAYGACMPDKLQSLREKTLQISDEETGGLEQLSVKYLSEIIDSRAREIIEAILFLIQESGYAEKLRSGIVLTGGGANLANLTLLIKEMSGYNVRIGYPQTKKISLEGCGMICETSAASSVGMLLSAKKERLLNCTDKMPEVPDNDMKDTVFEQFPETGNGDADAEKTPKRRGRGEPRETAYGKISWSKKVKEKLEGLFNEMN